MSTPGIFGPVPRQAAGRSDLVGPERGASSSLGVDLGTLVDKDTPLTWYEAVAIVQELCGVLLATRRSGPAPDLEPGDVAITAEGSVEVRGGIAPGLPTVTQVAHILLTLLGEAKTLPVQLRLLALQDLPPAPTDTTLREWSARLAAFERPGRQSIIRAVYERFMETPARDSGTLPTEPARARHARVARSPWWRSRKVRTAAASVALLVAAGIAAAWLWPVVVPLLSRLDGRGQRDAGAARAEESMSAEAVERIFARARRIWLGTGAGPAAPPPNATLDATPIHMGGPTGLPTGLPTGPAPNPAAALRLPEAAAGARTAAAEATVFSAADLEVVPPSLLRPHLPTSPRGGVRTADLPQVELLVSPTGEVESVKLVTQRAGVASAMMLSAIKTWRFEPANRYGQPVRYRVLVRLTNQ